MRTLLLSVALSLLLTPTAQADHFESTPTTIVVYKNGLAWVQEEGRGDTQNEWVSTRIHGQPVVGTLRLTGKGDLDILEVQAIPGPADQTYRTLTALTEEFKGKRIFVKTAEGERSGILLGVPAQALGGGEQMVALGVKDGTLMIPLNKILQVESDVSTANLPESKRTGDAELRLRLSRKEGEYHITSSYMTQFLGWLPTYQLDIIGEEGQLQLDAVVANDGLDLAGATVQFATGEGTFPLRYTQSPLVEQGTQPQWVMQQVMDGVRGGLNNLDNNNPAYNMMNSVPAQQMVGLGGMGDMDGALSSGEETHLYGPVSLTLKKGERASIPMGKGKVPAKFVYYYKAPLSVSNAPEQNTVWLAAQFTNKLKFPLTTGPILVSRKGRPVGQGFVTYTHEKGEALVPVSIASSVLASAAEQELDRDNSALTFRGAKYDKAVIKGTIAIENLQDKSVTVRIEKPVSGKVKKISDDGKSTARMQSAYDPNPTSKVVWTLELKPGKKQELTYHYDLYVHRYGKTSY
jgi:hypothetical protein